MLTKLVVTLPSKSLDARLRQNGQRRAFGTSQGCGLNQPLLKEPVEGRPPMHVMKKTQAFAPMATVFRSLLLVLAGNVVLWGQPAPQAPPRGQSLAPDQLGGLVAPIALYPDPLLSQILVASTYPLELVQAWQWLQRNPGLTGPALTQAAQDLVENIAPIQLAIRLLIPAGSRLLELPEM